MIGKINGWRIARICTAVLRGAVAAIVLIGPCFAQGAVTATSLPLGNKDGGKAETAIGDLVADAVRAALKADIAFVASSEIKPKDPPFPGGNVSSEDIAKLISYPNDSLAILALDGRTIRQALERSVAIYPQPNLGFLQVSGLKFTFDPKKSAGARVISITIAGSPIDDARTYIVAVSNSMANGALGYWKVWKADNVRSRYPDNTIIKSVDSYFSANQVIDYGKLERVSRK